MEIEEWIFDELSETVLCSEIEWQSRRIPIIQYNKLDRGGHFAAWEQPTLLAAEIRAAFRPLR